MIGASGAGRRRMGGSLTRQQILQRLLIHLPFLQTLPGRWSQPCRDAMPNEYD